MTVKPILTAVAIGLACGLAMIFGVSVVLALRKHPSVRRVNVVRPVNWLHRYYDYWIEKEREWEHR